MRKKKKKKGRGISLIGSQGYDDNDDDDEQEEEKEEEERKRIGDMDRGDSAAHERERALWLNHMWTEHGQGGTHM